MPSLIVFAVGAKILTKSGVVTALAHTPLRRLFAPLGVSAGGFCAFLVGLISGFPTGAAVLADLVRGGEMTREEAESLLPFCNNAGPAFVIGTIGAFLGSPRLGVILFAAQTASAILCVLLTAPQRRQNLIFASLPREAPPRVSAAAIVASAVAEGAAAMLAVSGFVVFFAVFSGSVDAALQAVGIPLGALGTALFAGFLEISGGFSSLSEAGLAGVPLAALAGAMLGFGGMSVFMQAADRAGDSINGGFTTSRYLPGKILCAALCAAFAVLFDAISRARHGVFLVAAALSCVILTVIAVRTLKNHLFFKKRVEKEAGMRYNKNKNDQNKVWEEPIWRINRNMTSR